MGLNKRYLDLIESSIADVVGQVRGKSMLELGDQVIGGDGADAGKTGKLYFQERGVEHVSIDLNGRNGALAYDLSRPIRRPDWIGYFDIVTNAGTTEHVEPHRTQYACFQNIHNFWACGGVAIHIVPDIHELEAHGHWKGHCCNYYSHEFFEMLCEHNGYRLVSSTVIDGLRCVCLQKTRDQAFMLDEDRLLTRIAQRSEGIVYRGINDHGLLRPFTRALDSILDVTRPLRHRLGIKRLGRRVA